MLEAEELPLLHTWSLAVEEQFYLVFPLFFIFIARLGSRATKMALQAAFIASLLLAAYGVAHWPTAAFYLLPTRAWELLLGTLLAIKTFPALNSPLQRNVATIAGAVLIGAPMLVYGPGTPFPGLAALPPCLGAALIIHAGESGESLVSRLLSLPPLVFVGMISYSLYLWHWPLLAFQRTEFLLTDTDSKFLARAVVLAASFIAATLSWWMIERPTRDRRLVPSPTLIKGVSAAACCVLAFAATLYGSSGLPGRFTPEAIRLASYRSFDDVPHFRAGQCFIGPDDPISAFDKAACLPDDPSKKRSLMVLGDSYAGALFFGLKSVLPDYNVMQITGIRCPPLVVQQRNPSAACSDLVKLALDEAAKRGPQLTVLLASRWSAGRIPVAAGWNPDWHDDLKKTVERFRSLGAHVAVIGQMPEYQLALPELLADAVENRDPELPQRLISQTSLQLDVALRKYSEANGLDYIPVRDILCQNDKCLTFAASNVPMFFDCCHLSDPGSVFLAKAIVRRLASAGNS
jgi:hypothetical protein